MHNDDFLHFLGMDGERSIALDERGTGVITRLWLTSGPPMSGSIRAVPMRLSIDGRDVILDRPLGELAGAGSTMFPEPWSLDPGTASGGLVIAAPIAFEQSARMELTLPPSSAALYYQADVRILPPDVCVHAFAGDYGAGERAALADAATLWRDHVHPGADHAVAMRDLAPGERTELALDGPGAITTIEVTTPLGTRQALTLRIETDGDVAADAPLAWLTGGDYPAGVYASALTASSASSATLYAPIPFASHARVVVTSPATATAPVSVALRVRLDSAAALDADVGRFRADCRSATVSIPVSTVRAPFTDTFANVVLATSSGRAGQFVGITTFQTAPDPWGWSLEADHEIAVDGFYDLEGTGTEDYFGGGFYFENGPYASVLSGASGIDRPDPTVMPPPDAHTHLYRHHLIDAIPFQDELRFELESYVNGTRYDGCAFFYVF
jgi:hypothetical protein